MTWDKITKSYEQDLNPVIFIKIIRVVIEKSPPRFLQRENKEKNTYTLPSGNDSD